MIITPSTELRTTQVLIIEHTEYFETKLQSWVGHVKGAKMQLNSTNTKMASDGQGTQNL